MFLFNIISQLFAGLILSGTVVACSAVVLLFALIACKLIVNQRPVHKATQVLALPMSETYQQIIPYMPRTLTIYGCRDIVLYATRAMVVYHQAPQAHPPPAVANNSWFTIFLNMVLGALWIVDLIISGFQAIQAWVGMSFHALCTGTQMLINLILSGFEAFQAWVSMSFHALCTHVQKLVNFIVNKWNGFKAWVVNKWNTIQAWVSNDNNDDVAPTANNVEPDHQAYLQHHLKNQIDWSSQLIDEGKQELTRRRLARKKLEEKKKRKAARARNHARYHAPIGYHTRLGDPSIRYGAKNYTWAGP